jgi:hypothetical protein
MMAEWIIDRNGAPVLIQDEHCFRSPRGDVVSWLFGNGVYAVNGDHIGWFEISTLYDVHNRIVGMLQHTCAPLSAERLPPPMPEFSRRPHVPRLKVRHSRPPVTVPPAAQLHTRPYAGMSMRHASC